MLCSRRCCSSARHTPYEPTSCRRIACHKIRAQKLRVQKTHRVNTIPTRDRICQRTRRRAGEPNKDAGEVAAEAMRWRGKCVVKDWPGRSLLAMCEDQAEGAWPSVAPERQRLAARGLIVYNPMAAWLTLCVYRVGVRQTYYSVQYTVAQAYDCSIYHFSLWSDRKLKNKKPNLTGCNNTFKSSRLLILSLIDWLSSTEAKLIEK